MSAAVAEKSKNVREMSSYKPTKMYGDKHDTTQLSDLEL